MKFLMNKKLLHIALLGIFTMAIIGGTVSSAAGAEPGSADDPVVSQSYVDGKINALSAQINTLTTQNSALTSQVNALKDQVQSMGTSGGTQGAKFQIVGPVAAGKKIIAGESTEIVLRGGRATAIASQYGGVADLISGTDLYTGADVPLNHLLLVPRDDGRGITVTSEAWVMVRGSYTIQ